MVCFIRPILSLDYYLAADSWFQGLHLTPDGYRVLYKLVMETIRAIWSDQDPEKLPMVFPGWLEAPK